MPDQEIAVLEPNPPETEPTPSSLEPGDKHWYQNEAFGIPEEIQKSPFIQRQPDLPTALKSLDHQGRTLSNKLTAKPTDESSPEERGKFYNEMGRPEKMEDYKVSIMVKGEDDKPVAIEFDETQQKVVDRLKKLAHNSGLSNKMFNTVLEEIIEEEQESYTQRNSPESATATLKEMWGKDYAKNSANAVQGWKSIPEPIQKSLMMLPLADRHQISAHIASLSQEPVIQSGAAITQGATTDTIESITSELRTLQAGNHKEFENAYNNNLDPNHGKAIGRFFELSDKKGKLKRK